MADPFLGEIRAVGFNFAPRGWYPCDGRLLSIAQNSALFAILGTTYGGNGQTNFALPNLQGNALVSQGTGPGLSQYVLGESIGTPTVTLLSTQIPIHNHSVNGATISGSTGMHDVPQNGDQLSRYMKAGGALGGVAYKAPPIVTPVTMAPTMVAFSGGSQPHNNQQPYLALLYCIAAEGIFPTRN